MISEISSLYEVHPNQFSAWKKQFLESATDTFSKPIVSEEKQKEQETDNLYRKMELIYIPFQQLIIIIIGIIWI